MSKSPLKDLERFEAKVKERLGELQPSVEEWTELTKVAGRLGIEVPTLDASHGTTHQAKRVVRRAPKRARRTATRRPRTDWETPLAAKVKEVPGTSPSKLAELIGDERKSSTYRIIRRWRNEGTVEERDGGIVWTA